MTDNGIKRKLRAILSADVKGYSRMMGADEVGTYKALTANLKSIGSIITKHDGRVFSSPGDAVMAEFSSVVDAVQCAVELQESIEAANAEISEDRKMHFRIGVNLGDVIHDGEQVYGDGVNIAARIETLAEPGGVSISRNVFNNVHNKLKYGYEYQGEHQVKNIAEPVRIYKVLTAPEQSGKLIGEPKTPRRASKQSYISILAILVIVAAAAVWHFYPRAPKVEPASVEKMAYALPDKPSIAVLPFDNMSNDPEQEYFSDGITEDIITALSKTPKMLVIARNSTFTYKGKAVKVRKVAEELGVQYVLEGSVRKEDDRVRVTAQLIDALSGHHVWSEKYDRDLEDIFALQDDLTKNIITAMQVKLTEGEQARVASRGTNNLDAYLKYLQAFSQTTKLNIEGNELGRQLALEAIELDPQYASPYLALATTHLMDIMFGRSKSPKESYAKRIELLKKAIELDASYAEAYGALGFTYALMGIYDEAIESAERGVSLDPNSAITHLMLGHVYRFSGRAEEAIPEYKKGIRLNPIPPAVYLSGLGLSYGLVGQYEEAIKWCKKAVSQEPDSFISRLQLTAVYAMAGQEEDARSEAKEVLRLNPKYSLDKAEKRAKIKYKDTWFAALRKAGLPDKPPLPLPEKPSIAVLPFENMSGDPEQQYFSDGFTEHIITSLSKVPYIFVIARQSSFSFRDKQMTVQQIAKELGVKYILEGSIQRSDERLRITAQLIDATSGHHIWADNYDRNLTDIFALQDEIAMKIMAGLQVNIAYETSGRYATIKTTNLKAYEKIIQGTELFLRRTEGDTLQARKLAEEAIALDPEYAIAYTLLGWTHLDDIWFYRTKDRAKSLETAEQLAHKAMDLSGPDPTSHRLLGTVFMVRKQYEKAIVEMQKAVELSPNSASSIFLYGLVLRYAGRYDEAIPLLEKAIRLNPVTPVNYLNNLAWSYALSEQYEKAIPLWNKAIERNPDYLFAYSGLTCTYQLMGNEKKAREAAAEVLRIKPTYTTAQIEEFDITNIEQKNRLLEAYHKAGIPGK